MRQCLTFVELVAQREDSQGAVVRRSEERKRVVPDDPETGQPDPLILIANPRQSIIPNLDGVFESDYSGKCTASRHLTTSSTFSR